MRIILFLKHTKRQDEQRVTRINGLKTMIPAFIHIYNVVAKVEVSTIHERPNFRWPEIVLIIKYFLQ